MTDIASIPRAVRVPTVHEVGDHGAGHGPLWLDDMLRTDLPGLVELRRRVHAHPELGHLESATTALIMRTLDADGIKATLIPSGTGVIAEIGSGRELSGCGRTSMRCRSRRAPGSHTPRRCPMSRTPAVTTCT